MRYMCAERNKLRRVFSTAIDLVKASPSVITRNHININLKQHKLQKNESVGAMMTSFFLSQGGGGRVVMTDDDVGGKK